MSLPLDQLQAMLLDFLGTAAPVSPDRVAALTSEDWQRIQAMVREHRLAPMLHWRLTHEHQGLPVPDEILASLAQSFRTSAMRGLGQQRDLLHAHRLLDEAGIPHVAMKGAYLTLHAYPNPAMRPLRDIDLLVPTEQTLAAFEVLTANGFTRSAGHEGDLDAYMVVGKHLPLLWAPGAGTGIEVHGRLYNPGTPGSEDMGGDVSGIWDRLLTLPLGGAQVKYMAPADLMLHLIIHAAYAHQFDNGPLIFGDIGYLLLRQDQAMDWPLFWSLATRSGTRHGALLVLGMVRQAMPETPITWPDDLAPGALEEINSNARAAARLSLRDMATRHEVNLASRMDRVGGLSGRIGIIARKIFIPRAAIAKVYPVAADSPMVYFWYLAKWYDLVMRRVPAVLASRGNDRARAEARDLGTINAWLARDNR